MNLYSKLENHLPREKEIPEYDTDERGTGNCDDDYDYGWDRGNLSGFNACKAQYDEVLRRVVVGDNPLIKYVIHDDDCICSQWRSGEPTKDGDYILTFGYGNNEKKFSRNKREHPVCTCGLDEAIANSPDVIKVEDTQNG